MQYGTRDTCKTDNLKESTREKSGKGLRIKVSDKTKYSTTGWIFCMTQITIKFLAAKVANTTTLPNNKTIIIYHIWWISNFYRIRSYDRMQSWGDRHQNRCSLLYMHCNKEWKVLRFALKMLMSLPSIGCNGWCILWLELNPSMCGYLGGLWNR